MASQGNPQPVTTEQYNGTESTTPKATGFAGILQSARNSINRNTEVFSEGLHKVVGGSTGGESGYETDSEASVTEVRHIPTSVWTYSAYTSMICMQPQSCLQEVSLTCRRHTATQLLVFCPCSHPGLMEHLLLRVSQYCASGYKSFQSCSCGLNRF